MWGYSLEDIARRAQEEASRLAVRRFFSYQFISHFLELRWIGCYSTTGYRDCLVICIKIIAEGCGVVIVIISMQPLGYLELLRDNASMDMNIDALPYFLH